MAENATPTDQRARPEAGAGDDDQDRVLATEPRAHSSERSREARGAQDLSRKRATYLSLLGLFVGLFVAVSAREGRGRRGSRPPIGPFDLGLLALSTFRLARIVSFDPVTEPIRAPVTEGEPGGGTKPKGRGVQRALGELISCPLCIGVWIAAAQTYGMLVVPVPTRVFATIFGAAGAAELLNVAVSTLGSVDRLAQQRRQASR
jgi:hypothetical protein